MLIHFPAECVNIECKRQMKGTRTGNCARLAASKAGRRQYWSGFSICLCIVLLSVFTWVVHRRLAQYESMQQAGGHHMTATKVCLTERPQISIPTTNAMDGFAMFFIAIAFAGALFRLDDSHASPVRREPPGRLCRTRIRPCLAHFFFLPPPASATAL